MLKHVVILTAVVSLGLLATAHPDAQASREKVLVRVKKPYASAVAAIEAHGGQVTHQYKHIEAIAAEVPRTALPAIRAVVGAGAITKDQQIRIAPPIDTNAIRGGPVPFSVAQVMSQAATEELSVQALSQLADMGPGAYQLTDGKTNVAPLHAAGYLGQDVIVAVVDSGLLTMSPPHLPGAVIGCEDFVGDGLPCAAADNGWHGSAVAGMVAGRLNLALSAGNQFRLAVLAECPACFVDPPANTVVPMIGTAPLASIYAFRVLGPNSSGSEASILAALDRIIELRQQFEAGNPAGRKIQVVNLSLGGTAVAAGLALEALMVESLIANDIVPVIGAGNTGPSSLTISDIASAHSGITVGAASLALNERLLRRLEYGPLVGSLYRPFGGAQTAYFSSRGPNADGRVDPDVVANGVASLVFDEAPALANGTSFAAPSVAGIAAVLRQRFPSATARQIRNAIIASANPAILEDGSTELDRGAGYVDAAAASALLAGGNVPDQLPALTNSSKSVGVNVEKNTNLNVREGLVHETTGALKPGERYDILYRVQPNTSQVAVALGVTPAGPPAQQNQVLGDAVLLAIHSAKTSVLLPDGDYYHVNEFVPANDTFTVNSPEPGLLRITITGSWTNAGNVSATVSIFSLMDPKPGVTVSGPVLHGQFISIPFNVPPGTKLAEVRLEWREDWGRYPTNDLDLILFGPGDFVNARGATYRSPEVVRITNPPAGAWLALIDGFELPTADDRFKLRITLDGKVVK